MPSVVNVIQKAVISKKRQHSKKSRKRYRQHQRKFKNKATIHIDDQNLGPFDVERENRATKEEGKPKGKIEMAREAARMERRRAVEDTDREIENRIKIREYLKSIGTDQNRLQF